MSSGRVSISASLPTARRTLSTSPSRSRRLNWSLRSVSTTPTSPNTSSSASTGSTLSRRRSSSPPTLVERRIDERQDRCDTSVSLEVARAAALICYLQSRPPDADTHSRRPWRFPSTRSSLPVGCRYLLTWAQRVSVLTLLSNVKRARIHKLLEYWLDIPPLEPFTEQLRGCASRQLVTLEHRFDERGRLGPEVDAAV